MASFKHLLRLSRNSATWTALQHRPTTLSTKFCKDFNEFYPRLIEKTFERSRYIGHPIVKDYLKTIATYYERCPVEGELMIHAYELLEKRENMNDKAFHQAYSVASVLELTQHYLYFQDDLYDKSLSRSGKKCWYLLPEASPMVLNDTSALRSLSNEILKQNVDKKIYEQIVNVNENCYLITEMGQYLDLILSKSKGYDNYTMDNYRKLSSLKATFFGVIYPIQAALVLSNKANEKSFQLVSDVLNDFGTMLQMHNDITEYVDYDETKSKKSNNDIEIGKFSWNAIIALENFSKKDRKIFEECYGSSDPDKITQVIKLYDKVDLVKLYRQAEASYNEELLRKIKGLPSDSTPSPEFFIGIMKYFKSYFSNIDRYYYI